jgi:hypothetical protein
MEADYSHQYRVHWSVLYVQSVFRGQHDIDSRILPQQIQQTKFRLDKQDQRDYRYQVVSASRKRIHLPSLISLACYMNLPSCQ